MKKLIPGLALSLLMILTLAACSSGGGGDDPGEPYDPASASQYTTRGWQRFSAGQYEDARSDFSAALGLDADHGEAFAGRAWSRLVPADDTADFSTAAADFSAAVNAGETGAYVHAGWACALLAQEGQLAAAAARAETALQTESNFSFTHRSTFNATDARLVWAFALAGQGDFAGALAQADQIVTSGIDAADPGSWEVGLTAYGSFAGAVLGHLHQLSESYAG